MRAILASLTIILFAGQAYAIDDEDTWITIERSGPGWLGVNMQYLLLAISVWLLASGTAFAKSPVNEARCTALGANCICSSSFDTDNFVDDATWTSSLIDPSKWTVRYTEADATTEECSNASRSADDTDGGWFGSTGHSLNSSPGFLAGSTSTYAWSITSDGGTHQAKHNEAPSAGADVRQCLRYYVNFTTGYDWACSGGNEPASRKQARLLFNDSGSCHFLEATSGGWYWDSTIDGGETSDAWTTNGDPGTECTGANNWCRVEVCVAGNLVAQTGMTLYGRVNDASDGTLLASDTWVTGLTGTGSSLSTEVEFYRESCSSSTRSVSHMMIAEWATDADQWIGAASEIEGGGGAATPSVSGAAITGGSIQ